MLTKTLLKEQLEKLPEEFSIDELVERLVLIEKIERGIVQSDRGEVIADADLSENLDSLSKKILSFSGLFSDLDRNSYADFLDETKNVRAGLFNRHTH